MVTKSPTWTVKRPPARVVILVTRFSWSRVELPPGRLRREKMTVPWYLSEAKSTCTPSQRGLEKVIGVSVERISLLTVTA